ncbi:GNAT family N-acetyltransferase [Rhizobium cremeum]|uniref:GNAT family N-acetyltransferase n=1 Tax=Rhizobium cremeum TaxID=2813827 RepID=UPI000DDE0E81|nr:GNAT family N-acetyltransferase [Rhizobium cremeum]MCJ7994611.1 GNAT family N-acetyltransferase [Rhizobium cremeum]MCJ8000393.1 GNAT family N-acetyltransferase [Rhizobium cremeum]
MQAPDITIREADRHDVAAIAAILAADTLGGHGDSTDPAALPGYLAAFDRIAASPCETLYVAERNGEVVATCQTLATTTLSGRGGTSMIVETVFTRPDCRGQGIGAMMIHHCVDQARRQGMRRVQLTSNAARKDAHRFYERLGFTQSHLGFKLQLK